MGVEAIELQGLGAGHSQYPSHSPDIFGVHTTPSSTELSQQVRFGMLTSFFFQAEQKVEDSNRWE